MANQPSVSAKSGRQFLLKVSDGTSPTTYTTVGGLQATSLVLNNNPVDITNKAASFREWLADGGVREYEMSGSGVMDKGDVSAAAFRLLETAALNATLIEAEITSAIGDRFMGLFVVVSLTRDGSHGDSEKFTITLKSSGPVVTSLAPSADDTSSGVFTIAGGGLALAGQAVSVNLKQFTLASGALALTGQTGAIDEQLATVKRALTLVGMSAVIGPTDQQLTVSSGALVFAGQTVAIADPQTVLVDEFGPYSPTVINGNGTTDVTWAWSFGGPNWYDISGPHVNLDGSVWFQEIHASGLIVILDANCRSLTVGSHTWLLTTGGTFAAVKGDLTFTKAPATITNQFGGVKGDLVLAGQAVGVSVQSGAQLTASKGDLSLAGQTVGLSVGGGQFTVVKGGLALTGQTVDATIPSNREFTPFKGGVTLTGQAVSLGIAPFNSFLITEAGPFTHTGDGRTAVTFAWSFGGPNAADIIGPFVNDDGSVWFREVHTSGITVTLTNCYSFTVGSTTWLTADATIARGLPHYAFPTPVIASTRSSSGMAVQFADGRIFNQADGNDLGDYANPFTAATHKNISVLGANHYKVIFRPENDSSRFEVAFEWSNIFSAVQSDMGSLSVDIYNNGSLIGSASTPSHIWGTTWFWESAPRAIVKTAAQLVSEKWVLPMDQTATSHPAPAHTPDYTPMGRSGVYPGMPDTGARPDIGVVTQLQAYLIATGNASYGNDTIQWGHACNSLAVNVTDPWTGAVVSYDDYPNMHFYLAAGDPVPRPVGYHNGTLSNGFSFDGSSHLPSLNFVPFALTGDIKHLLAAQRLLTILLAQTPTNPAGVIENDGTRIFAWGLRDLFNMCRMMSEFQNPPPCLLPYSYWKKQLDKNLVWYTAACVENSLLRFSLLRSGTDPLVSKFWSDDYLACTMGQGVWQGNEDWRTAFDWKLGSNISRTNDTDGWPWEWPSGYTILMFHGNPTIEEGPVTGWADMAALNGLMGSHSDTIATGTPGENDATYTAWCRSALRVGKFLGVSGCAEVLPRLERLSLAMNTGPDKGGDWQESY